MQEYTPFLDVSQFFNQDIKVDSIRRVEIVLVPVCSSDLIRGEGSVERVLEGVGITKTYSRARQTNHRQNDNPRQAHLLDDGQSKRRLARTRAAGNANDARVGPRRRVVGALHSLERVEGGHIQSLTKNRDSTMAKQAKEIA